MTDLIIILLPLDHYHSIFDLLLAHRATNRDFIGQMVPLTFILSLPTSKIDFILAQRAF